MDARITQIHNNLNGERGRERKIKSLQDKLSNGDCYKTSSICVAQLQTWSGAWELD
jgi:hypothetical protein